MESRETLLPKASKNMIEHICLGCGKVAEKTNKSIQSPKCFGCVQKRKREAAINYYNLKRRKQYAK